MTGMGTSDRLVLEGMRFFAHHGDVPAERELGSHVYVDVEIDADLRTAAGSDDIADTVDYVHCYELIRALVEEQQHRLLETVAAQIADTLLQQPRALAVRVRVAKQPPMAADFHRFAVVVERRAEQSS